MPSDDGEDVNSVSQPMFPCPSSLVGVFLIFLFLLSGCLEGESVYYGIDVEFLSEDEIAAITHPYMNITHIDFSDYPTLYQAITFLIDPSANQSHMLLETPQEEWNRIHSDIGDSFTYYRYYFWIGYVIS